MSDEKRPGEDQGYTPASPVKRTLAWIGLSYMVILVALTTYYFFTGTTLGNLGPLLTVPGLIGLGAVSHCELALHRPAGQGARHSSGRDVLGAGTGHPAHRHCRTAEQLWRLTL